MDPHEAHQRLQDVRLQAYTSVLRCLRDKSLNIASLPRETMLTKLRLEFGITREQHTDLLAQAVQEESQMLAAPSHSYVPAAPKPAAIRKQPSKAAAKAKPPPVVDVAPHLPAAVVHTVAPTYVPAPMHGAADRKKRIAEMNFRKVKRWWPNEGGWWDAVITKYNPDTGACELVYNLNKKGMPIQSESYNLHASTVDHCNLSDDFASAAELRKYRSSG